MKLVDKYSWVERLWQRVGNVLLMASLLFAVTAVEAGTLKTSIEGCRAGSSNGYTLTTQPIFSGPDIPMYICNDSAYTTGNLKTWAELDMVPHRFIVSNGTGVAQDFNFSVGGDYQDANDENLTGWDYITPLTLDPVLSDQACFDIENLSFQDLVITPDNQTIYRTVSVVGLPDGVTCVANYNMRLSIGSSGYPGSSLQDFLLDGGKQTLPLPAVTATTFSKTMTAVQAGIRNWTVTKSSSPGTLNFDDTCAVDAVLEKDVNITVSWTKGEVTPAGMVNVSTVISASNTASRDINISVVDTLYGGTTVLDTRNCGPTVLTANTVGQTVCSNTFTINAAAAVALNDKAVATYTDPDILENPILTTKEATASATVQGSGSNTYDTVIVKDHEWISGNSLSYSADLFNPANIGAFDGGYIAGTDTTGDVNWTSITQDGNGSVTFNKTVYAQAATETTGTLSDRAYLMGSDGFVVANESVGINLSSSALVRLTIYKTIDVSVPLVADTNFTFSVRNEAGDDRNITIPFLAGDINGSITIEGMDPGLYEVTELPVLGYEAEGNSSRVINLNLPTCAASVTFNNIAAGRPAVQVAKITDPAILDDIDQAAGWTMTLYYQEINSTVWTEINSTVTTAGGEFKLLQAEDALQPGNYKIEETPPSGEEGKWYLAGLSDECQFSYDLNDENRSDYECIFYNKKYAAIIINKVIEPSNPGFNAGADFSFAQDINSSVPLVLGDGESETYLNLKSGIHEVTENDPRPDFDLSGLTCDEYYDTVDTPAVENSVTDVRLRKATINLDPGETVECTFTNRERGRLNLIKLEDGVENISQFWKFTLEGPDGIMERNTSTSLNFEDARLIPGETYRLCEIDVNIAWDAVWTLEGTEVFPVSEVLDNTRDTCYEFSVLAGEEANFVINNISPPNDLHLGNYVWYDDNNNGIQDAGEDPVEGLKVELLDENGVLVKDLYNEDTHITDADGQYDFYVEEGNYSIRFSGLPANYVFAKTKMGTDDSIDSDANSNGVTAVVSVSGVDNFDLDAGIYCICNEISSSSSPAMNQISAALMIIMTMMIGLFFVRREEQFNRNER